MKQNSLSLCVLASGSRGNSIYITDGSTSILFDAGLSGIEIQRRLNSRGRSPENLDAIVVSHEHDDHIRGVGVLSRRFKLPVFINRETYKSASSKLGSIETIYDFDCGSSFQINTLTIHPFSISHDAEDPSGFTVNKNGAKIGIATDLGIVTSMVKEHLKGCSLLVLEANHDPVMLAEGPYPWPVKQRVKSRVGHLSNEESKNLLSEVKHNGLLHVVLAHLSEQNNTPQKALAEVGTAINNCGTTLSVAQQHECGEILVL